MLELYTKVDPIIESMLLNAGVSVRATDFIMLGLGGMVLLCMVAITIGLILVYGRILITAYMHMIYDKNPRLRRNWSLIFLVTLIIVVLTLIKYIG